MSSDKINMQQLLTSIFTTSNTNIKDNVVFGSGMIKDSKFNILGTVEDTSFGVDEAI